VIFSDSHAIDSAVAMVTLPQRPPVLRKYGGTTASMKRNSQGDYDHSQTIQSAAANPYRTARQQ
jgi:hypothetical protein